MSLRRVTVTGGTLFEIALRELGDARQWWRIAQANGLLSPQLSGVTALLLPPRNATLKDGVPPGSVGVVSGPTVPSAAVVKSIVPPVVLPSPGIWDVGRWDQAVWAP